MQENIIEKAIIFATNAHKGDIRKSEPDKPKIIHPLAVMQILLEYGADNNVVAAGILHDVVEDTIYTLEDLRREFNDDIAHLVECASEPDKSLSWEERKQDSIDKIKNYSLREKLVPLADKINNIEDLERLFARTGFKDFSSFKRGKEKQEWYYRNMYESFASNDCSQNPLVKRLELSINNVFERTMDEYYSCEKDKTYIKHY